MISGLQKLASRHTVRTMSLPASLTALSRDDLVKLVLERLLNELRWYNDRGNLLRFLDDPRIEPTKNRAERALRPAVIAHKVSQCSKNARGAQAVASVVHTLTRTGTDSIVEGLLQVFHSGQMPDASAEACHQSR